ncbi:hypothetical protein GCM10029963_36010 [Micromonospora andamanensis]|nr:hypothetical protein Vwe01_37710 [Micromonospora andamanensis]
MHNLDIRSGTNPGRNLHPQSGTYDSDIGRPQHSLRRYGFLFANPVRHQPGADDEATAIRRTLQFECHAASIGQGALEGRVQRQLSALVVTEMLSRVEQPISGPPLLVKGGTALEDLYPAAAEGLEDYVPADVHRAATAVQLLISRIDAAQSWRRPTRDRSGVVGG